VNRITAPEGATSPLPTLSCAPQRAHDHRPQRWYGGRRRDQERPAGGCETHTGVGAAPAPKRCHVGAGRDSGGSKRGVGSTRSPDPTTISHPRPRTGRRLMPTGTREVRRGAHHRQIRRLMLNVRRVVPSAVGAAQGSARIQPVAFPAVPYWLVACHQGCHPGRNSAVCEISRPAADGGRRLESPDQGDDGAAGRVQGEHHGDTPAVKVENVADDGTQREVEGGDHRLPLQPDHRGQRPPVDPTAQDRGRRRDLPGRVVQRLRPSPQGLHTGRGRGRCARPIRGPPTRPRRRPPAPRPGRNQDIATLFPVHRRHRDDARRRAEPPARPGGAPSGRDWPVPLATGGCEANPERSRLGGPRAPCRHRKCHHGSGRPTGARRSSLHR
jgi:hypothetical protein